MDKKEKYMEFIAEDLFKKTEIDHEQKTITGYPYTTLDIINEPIDYFTSFDLPSRMFERYVTKIYGAADDEFYDIWVLYKRKIQRSQ